MPQAENDNHNDYMQLKPQEVNGQDLHYTHMHAHTHTHARPLSHIHTHTHTQSIAVNWNNLRTNLNRRVFRADFECSGWPNVSNFMRQGIPDRRSSTGKRVKLELGALYKFSNKLHTHTQTWTGFMCRNLFTNSVMKTSTHKIIYMF